MKVKVGSVILGFVMICIGIAALAGQTPVFGIHPIVWFILGAMLICSDSAWEKLAHAKRHEHRKEGSKGKAFADEQEGGKTAHAASTGKAPSNGATPSVAEDSATANGIPASEATPSGPSSESASK